MVFTYSSHHICQNFVGRSKTLKKSVCSLINEQTLPQIIQQDYMQYIIPKTENCYMQLLITITWEQIQSICHRKYEETICQKIVLHCRKIYINNLTKTRSFYFVTKISYPRALNIQLPVIYPTTNLFSLLSFCSNFSCQS